MNPKAAFAACMVAVCLAAFSALGAAPKLPAWDRVEKVVAQQLNTVADYQPGDLIARGEVDPMFDQLARLGWTVADRLEIVALVPADSDHIVRQFRSPGGKKFMRDSGQMGYDRIDQIDHVTLGPETIDALISRHDGAKKIQELGTSTAKQNQSWMIAPSLHGANFNAATGRIYTANELLDRLKKSYDLASAGK